VVGGSSFADAPVVEPGSYRDNLVAGEVLTYQVEVGYGQQLSALVDFPELDGKLRDAVSGGLITQVDAFTPARAPVAPPRTGDGPFAKTFLSSDGEDIGFSTAPVSLSNATETDPIGSTTVPGMYTVTVFLEEDPGGEDYLVPFRLDVDVTGTELPGPELVEEPLETEPTNEPTPREDGDGGGEDPQASSAASDDDDSPLGLVVGGLGVLALLSGAYLAISRRRASA
jgi:Ca-activated chloride channel family protein